MEYDSSKFPGIPTLYDLGLKLNEFNLKRFDVIESRGSALLATIISVSVAVVSFVASHRNNVAYSSISFELAIFLMITSLVLLTIPRFVGRIETFKLDVLFEDYSDVAEDELKSFLIQYMIVQEKKNREAINLTALLTTIALFTFSLEAVALAVWAAA